MTDMQIAGLSIALAPAVSIVFGIVMTVIMSIIVDKA